MGIKNNLSTRHSSLKNFTRGGQIILHNIRMFIQIMHKVSYVIVIVFFLIAGSMAVALTTEYERYVLGEYFWATVVPFFNDKATTAFLQPNGVKSVIPYTAIQQAPLLKAFVQQATHQIMTAVVSGIIASFILMLGIFLWLKQRGERHTEDDYLKGDHIASVVDIKQIMQQRKIISQLSLGKLPIPGEAECAHFFFHGTTGTGKSTAIKALLDQIRKRNDRAIIYDKSCNYLEEFYQPQNDILLNPLDERGEAWDLWSECRDSADFDSLAAAQIPMPLSTQDPFWVNAARTIFSAAAFEMRSDPNRSIPKLLRYLLTADLEQIQRFLKGTEAETLVSDKIEKTAISIKSVLATYLKSMKYIKENENPFSIRQWIQNDKASHWLFITSLGDRHETLKPLISAWLDIAVNALLSLHASQERRLWLILDELTSLQPLPYLTQALSEARKFGGCIVIGVQNAAQLAKLYGHEGGREISSLLNTRLMFRQPDPEMAKWSAINLGETVMDEVREGISYGANTMRDGISINRVETRKPVVSFSEILCLPNLEAYIRLPGNYPLTRIHFDYITREKINAPFCLRAVDEHPLKETAQSSVIQEEQKVPTKGNKKSNQMQKKKKPVLHTTLTT